MDWNPTELQAAVRELATQVLTEAPDAWAGLVDAELLTVDGVLEQTELLVCAGLAGAPVPVFETVALGGPLRAAGFGEAGDVLTGAVVEDGRTDLRRARTRYDGGLHGTKVCVPALDRATWVAVAADDGVYAVRVSDARWQPQHGTNDDVLGVLTLDGTPAERLGGTELLEAWRVGIHLGVSALHLGLARGALGMTAAYVRERKQFGRPIGTFQAVSQRIADAWIDVSAMEVTLWQAAWRVSEGLPCERELLIARYHAAEGSHRVLAAAQHLHGGFGFDRDYPLHRYFLTSKLWEFLLGGASSRLEELGDHLAGVRP
ncbi:MAG: acyl-CoA dehydrogenase [Alphaproteobacteria bacterium]|nr:acyl-CoA dehydrogenase [Alphaproteobacteria bacterium]